MRRLAGLALALAWSCCLCSGCSAGMDTDIRFLSPEAQSTLTTPTTDVEIAVVSHRDPRCLFSDVSFGEVRKGEGPVTLRVTAIAGFERVSEAIAVELAPEDDSSGGDDSG